MFTAWKYMQEEKPLIDDDICEILNEKEIHILLELRPIGAKLWIIIVIY